MDPCRYFNERPQMAIAFSGGVDSTCLAWLAVHYSPRVRGYYVSTPFQPSGDRDRAVALAQQLGMELTVLELDILSCPEVTANPADRCYHCKSRMFRAICAAAKADGFHLVADGTNASDEEADRPGLRALRELSVISPLRELELCKDQIRQICKTAGLPNWDQPAYACLATRIPTGCPITDADLRRTERAEAFLSSLGFSDLRVRLHGDMAKLQLPVSQLPALLRHREQVLEGLKRYYPSVVLDLEVRDG